MKSTSWADAMKAPKKSKSLFPTVDQIRKGVRKSNSKLTLGRR